MVILKFFLSVFLFLFFSSDCSASQVYYVHSDHLGSTAVITNESGEEVQSDYYYPFGSSRSSSSPVADDLLPTTHDSQPPITEHQYTSQISDEDQTGLYYYNARYYDPQIAKFTQADTRKDGLNSYAYVSNNPINFIDPTGNMEIVSTDYKSVVNTDSQVDSASFQKKILAMAVMSETYNGKVSPSGMMFMALFMVQRFNSGGDVMDTAFWILVDSIISESAYADQLKNKSNDEKTQAVLTNCLENPDNCKEQSRRFQESMVYIEDAETLLSNSHISKSYLFKNDDKLFFAAVRNLNFNSGEKGILKFESIEQKLIFLFLNYEQYKFDHPGFDYSIATYTDDESGMIHIAIAANDNCSYTLSCGSYRKEAYRVDKLDEQYQQFINDWKAKNSSNVNKNPPGFSSSGGGSGVNSRSHYIN